MKFDHKQEHRDNVIFSIQKVAIALLRDAIVCILIIELGNSFFHNEIIMALQNTVVQKIIIVIVGIALLYEIRNGRKLCVSLDGMHALLELRISGDEDSLLICNSLIRSTERWIDVCQQKINIMTSLSPLPITVLIIGFLIDKSKFDNLLWNQYTILLIGVFLFYAIALFRSYDMYKELRYQLNEEKDTREKIAMQLKDKKLHQSNT